jgi:hypothetical protein
MRIIGGTQGKEERRAKNEEQLAFFRSSPFALR